MAYFKFCACPNQTLLYSYHIKGPMVRGEGGCGYIVSRITFSLTVLARSSYFCQFECAMPNAHECNIQKQPSNISHTQTRMRTLTHTYTHTQTHSETWAHSRTTNTLAASVQHVLNVVFARRRKLLSAWSGAADLIHSSPCCALTSSSPLPTQSGDTQQT